MASITYLTGDATAPVVEGPTLIAHICNDVGGWGRGFVLELSKRWPEPEREYRKWFARGQVELGAVQVVSVATNLWVVNMVAQHGIKTVDGIPPIRYEALQTALERVAIKAQAMGAVVVMPRIGSNLAGGHWVLIEPIVVSALVETGIDVTVYSLPR